MAATNRPSSWRSPLSVAKTTGGRDRREIRVRPVGGRMRNLIYEQWVRDNRRKVEEASDGRLGYLHIRGMGNSNLFQFEEDLFAQELEARRAAARERTEITGSGLSKAEELYNESMKEVVTIKHEADQKAAEEIEKTKPAVHQEAEILADEILERLLGRRIAG